MTQLDKQDPIIVIGAGFVGVSTALYLQQDGREVILIDREGPAAGASYGNASIMAVDTCAPVALPGILWKVPGMLADPLGPLAVRWSYLPKLAPWLIQFIRASNPKRVEELASQLATILGQAMTAYEPLLKEAGLEERLKRRGFLGVYTRQAAWDEAEKGYIGIQRRHGVRVETMSAEEMRQMEPALSRTIVGGVFYPEVGNYVEPGETCRLLAEHFLAKGGKLLREEVTDLLVRDGQVRAVKTKTSTHDCAAAVIAAGAWSKVLAKQVGAPVPLDTERGYNMTFPRGMGLLSRPLYSTEFGIAVTPLDRGLRVGGMVELGGLDAPPNWKRSEMMKERARKLLPDIDCSDGERWMGFRPSMPDSLPVIGASPSVPNAYLAFGHGHLGVTLGAFTGRCIADLVAGREPIVDISAFSAARF